MPITYPFTVDIPEPLATYYFDLSRDTGKKVAEIIVSDLSDHQKATNNPVTAHPVILPPYLEAEYSERASNGKTIPEIIVRDLEEYWESKRFHENYREKAHP